MCTNKMELSNDLSAINSLDSKDHVDFSINLENYLPKQTITNQDKDSDFTNLNLSLPRIKFK